MRPPRATWHVATGDGPVVVTVTGALDVAAGSALYRALMPCLTAEPVAILLELSAMTVTEPDAAKIFPILVRQAEIWPGTPLLLCAPSPAVTTLITNWAGDSPPSIFPTVTAGVAALSGRDKLLSELVVPAPGAVRRARDIVTEACLSWDLPHLLAPATLVTSELVTNAMEHAKTYATLQVRLRPRLLYLAVFDGAHSEPVRRPSYSPETTGGRGLHLVDVVATRWGFLRRIDGKVVWAALAT